MNSGFANRSIRPSFDITAYFLWSQLSDLNRQPVDYKSTALPIELSWQLSNNIKSWNLMIDFSFYHLYFILKYDQSLAYDVLEHKLVVNDVKIVFIKLSSNSFLYMKTILFISKPRFYFKTHQKSLFVILIAVRIFILL